MLEVNVMVVVVTHVMVTHVMVTMVTHGEEKNGR